MLIELALFWIIATIGCAMIGNVKGFTVRAIVIGLLLGPVGVLICLASQSTFDSQADSREDKRP